MDSFYYENQTPIQQQEDKAIMLYTLLLKMRTEIHYGRYKKVETEEEEKSLVKKEEDLNSNA